MALVDSGVWQVTATFVDNDNNRSPTSFNLPGASTYAEAYTDATAIIAAAAALSNGAVAGFSITRGTYEDALDFGTLSEASEVERKGVFGFRGTNPAAKTRMEIPSLNSAFVVDGSNVLDVNNATVLAFINAVITAGAVTNTGVVLTNVLPTPHKIHRGSSKG